jgi:hypothetical protein
MQLSSSFDLTAAQIQALLDPTAPLLPELDAAREAIAALKKAPQTKLVLAATKDDMADIAQIPATTYTPFRLFVRTGDRATYETPYFAKRARFGAAALRLFLGEKGLKDVVQDYIWNICEETTWVLPAHERCRIDLFSAESGLMLAEAVNMLGDALDAEVRSRVRQEIETRIFDPYMRYHQLEWWYTGHNNWNGVCNSSVAMTFLLLDPETGRTAQAVAYALSGLKIFLETAFEEDGTSSEGPGYWGYGLLNFIPLSEMLRARSHGKIDLLQGEHMRLVAGYPGKVRLSANMYASFSDSHEHTDYNPGILTRLAERTGEKTLLDLLSYHPGRQGEWRVGIYLRNLLWWNGALAGESAVSDAYLAKGAVARLVGSTAKGAPVVVAVKAGHNEENHNQNDIGSFIVHVGGETLLCDPGAGLYTRQYFSAVRYENVFANSYGHSVPRINGTLQPAGRQYEGAFLGVDLTGTVKKAGIDMTRAYAVDGLTQLVRSLTIEPGGVVRLSDAFEATSTLALEEALITWLPVEVKGVTAVVRGQKHALRLTIEDPAGATFAVEELTEACKTNEKPLLRRITCAVPAGTRGVARIRMQVD